MPYNQHAGVRVQRLQRHAQRLQVQAHALCPHALLCFWVGEYNLPVAKHHMDAYNPGCCLLAAVPNAKLQRCLANFIDRSAWLASS